MRNRNGFSVLVIALGLAITTILGGCGGNASRAPSAGNGSGGSGGSGSGGSGGSPTPAPPAFTPPANSQFQQSIIINGAAGHGSVYVSTSGDVTVQLTGAQPSAAFNWRFCPMGTDNTPCFDLAQTLMTDAGGNGQLTFHFPRSGKWSGYFDASSGASTVSTQNATLGTMLAIFLSSAELNGTPPCGACRIETLQSGSVAVANQIAHIILVDADPGNPNQVQEVDLFNGATSTNLGNIVMDANDNLTADVPLQGASGAAIGIWDHNNEPIASGFQVS